MLPTDPAMLVVLACITHHGMSWIRERNPPYDDVLIEMHAYALQRHLGLTRRPVLLFWKLHSVSCFSVSFMAICDEY